MVGLDKLYRLALNNARTDGAVAYAAPVASADAPPPAAPPSAPGLRDPAPWGAAVRSFFQGLGAPASASSTPAPATSAPATTNANAANGANATNATNAAKPPPPPPPPATPTVVSDKKATEFGPTPWTWNKWLPENPGDKSPEYAHWRKLHNAAAHQNKAEKAAPAAAEVEKKATETRDAAKAKLTALAGSTDRTAVAKATRELKSAEDKLTAAQTKRKAADEDLVKAKQEVTDTSAAFKTFLKGKIGTARTHDADWVQKNQAVAGAEKALKDEQGIKPRPKEVTRLQRELDRLTRSKAPQADIAAKQAELDTEKNRKPDPAKVATLTQDLATKKTARDDREKQILADMDAYKPIDKFERRYVEMEVNGTKVYMADHVDAYSTELADGLKGYTPSVTENSVNTAVDASNLGKDDKLIMKGISAKEGNFATTENFDVGGVTWGMTQWTSGQNGDGSMIEVMKKIKSEHPDTYNRYFRDNGIDYDATGHLKVTKDDGTVVSGAAAVKELRTNPRLTAALVAAGADTDVQAVQIEMSKSQKIDREGLNRPATVTVKGQQYTFQARDIFKSDIGAAMVANAGVHGGPGEVSRRLREGLEAFFAKHPDADPKKPETWRAQAEQEMLDVMTAGDGNRRTAFRDAGLKNGVYGVDD